MSAPFNSTTSFTVVHTNFTAPITTLCDGNPRIKGSLTPIASATRTFIDGGVQFNYTSPAPTCSIDREDCLGLWKDWITTSNSAMTWTVSLAPSATALYIQHRTIRLDSAGPITRPPVLTQFGADVVANHGTTYTVSGSILLPGGPPITILNPTDDWSAPPYPGCSLVPGGDTICGICDLEPPVVRLIYFPVTTNTSRNMCAMTPVGEPTECPYGPTTQLTYSNSFAPNGESIEASTPCLYAPLSFSTTTDSGKCTSERCQTDFMVRRIPVMATNQRHRPIRGCERDDVLRQSSLYINWICLC